MWSRSITVPAAIYFLCAPFQASAGPRDQRFTRQQVQQPSADRNNPRPSDSGVYGDGEATLIIKLKASAASGSVSTSSSQVTTQRVGQDPLQGITRVLNKEGLEKPSQIFGASSLLRAQQGALKAGGSVTALSNSAKGAAIVTSTDLSSLPTTDRLAILRNRFPRRAARQADPDLINPPSLDLSRYYSVKVPKIKDTKKVEAALRATAGVANVYRSLKYKTSSVPLLPPSAYKNVWGIDAVKAPAAWAAADTLGEGIVVGINDTGIYYKHTALSPNVWRNEGEIPGNCVDDDGNGYVDDEFGMDFTYSSRVSRLCGFGEDLTIQRQPFDCNGHGSHVAGTIGGSDPESGVVGIAPRVKLMAAKALDDGGSGYTDALAQAIVYMTDNGADVINNSWGSGPISYEDPLLTDAIRYAAAAGVINVFAAGNESYDMTLSHPANMPEVVTVGAIDSDNQRAEFSNFGARVDVVAPGVDVNSSFPDGCANTEPDSIYDQVPVGSREYTQISGTSMAAPHVSGAIALLLAANPALRVDQVRTALRATADDLGAPGFDPLFGAGKLNVLNAIKYVKTNQIIPPVDLRLSTRELYRNANNTIANLTVRGTITGVSNYKLTIRPWASTAEPEVLVAQSGTIRNKLIGPLDLSRDSRKSPRKDGRYVLEISGRTAANRLISRTDEVTILSPASTLASTAGIPYKIWSPASFNSRYATWEYEGYRLSESEAPAGKFQVVSRGSKPSVAATYEVGDLFSGLDFGPKLLALSPTSPASISPIAVGYYSDNTTGSYPDVAVFDDKDAPDVKKILYRALPPIRSLTPVPFSAMAPDGMKLLWRVQNGLGTVANSLYGYRGSGTPERLVTSPKNTMFWGSSIFYPNALENKTGAYAGRLVTFEAKLSSSGQEVDTLTSYNLVPANIESTRRVLYTPGRAAYVDTIDYGYGLGCLFMLDRTVGRGSNLTVVNTGTGQSLMIAEAELGDIGQCRIPQENFVTYVQYVPEEGFKLVGYDFSPKYKTPKRGAVSLPLGYGFVPGSITSTLDGNLSWKEYYGAGSRLVEFDVTAFRKGIADGTVAAVP